MIASTTQTDVLCNGNATGSIDLTVTGGSGTYSYSWNTTPVQTTEDLSNLAAGSYTVTVTDQSNCTTTATAILTEPTAPLSASTTQTNVLCNGNTTGSIDLTVVGGTSPYTYSWNTTPVQTTQDLSNIGDGSYTATITDDNGCSTTASVTITEPGALIANLDGQINVTCFGGNNGSVLITPSGGVGPYSISPAQNNLIAGSYTFIVTDNNGCQFPVNAQITEPQADLTVSISSQTNVSCNGLSDGSVVLAISGGSAPYTTSPSTTNLSPGTYTFTVTDNNGCAASVLTTITEPLILDAQASSTIITTSGGTSTVIVTATGGTPAYVGTGTFTVTAGTYTYTVTDANGCTSDTTLTITEPLPLTVTATGSNAACFGDSVPVTVVGNGGTTPYTGDGTFNVAAGTYTYTITDFYGNTASTSITITQPTALVASSNAVLNALACSYDSTLVTVSSTGGTGVIGGIGNFYEGTGVHSYIVTDANGCQDTTSVTITAPPAIVTSVSVQDVYCSGGTGSVDLTISSGVGPYDVIWDGTVFTEDLAAVVAGTYVAEVTDDNGCIAIQSATVINDFSTTPIGINNLTGTTTLTCIVTSINLQGFGGSNYVWSGGSNLTGAANTITTPGTYTLDLDDSNGCPKQLTIVIDENIVPPTAGITNISNTSIITCSTPTINVLATGGVSYNWSGGLGTNATQGITAVGTYSVTVTGTNGCISTESITITNDILPPTAGIINNTASNTLNCNYSSISLTATGGVTYVWSNSMGTNATISVTVAGTYTVTVRGTNGCTDTESFVVDFIPNPTLTVNNTTICSGNSVTLNAIATPLLGGTYTWSGGLGSSTNTSITTPILGTNQVYQVSYTDPNGCISNTVNVTISVLQSPTVTVSGTTTMCSGTNGVLTAIPSIAGGTPNWSSIPAGIYPSTLSITVSPTITTTYTVNYLALNGCISPNVSATISVIPTPVITAPSTGICTGGQTTITATPNLLGGTYIWSPLPAGQVNGPSIQVSPAATTNYDIVYALNGCASIPVTVQVTVTDQPTVSVADIGICTGATGTMVAVPSSTAGVGTYTWSPSWTTSAVDDETFDVSPPQTSPISVVYTLNNCPSSPVTAFVTVTNAPTLSFTGTNLCAGSTGTLTAVPSFPGGTFEWENGDITASIQITPNVDTTYYVDYNLNGCIVTGTANVTVNEVPNVTFIATVTEGCAPLTVNLVNTTASTNNCTWDLGNGGIINQCGTLSYTFMNAGCYDISLTADSPNGCSNTLTIDDLVCVYPQPIASFNTTTEVISSDNPTLNVTNTSVGAVNYTWNYGNGVTETSVFQPEDITYTGDIETEYIITLIAISENGCIDSTYRVIKVSDELLIFAPNTFIPDGDGLNDTWFPLITAGMEENTYELIIVNRWGEIMFQTQDITTGWDGTYQGRDCQDGVYSFNIRFRSTFDKQNKNITGHINLLR